MRKVVKVRRKPPALTPGLLIAAVFLVIYHGITDDVSMLALILCFVIRYAVDAIYYGLNAKFKPGVYIEDDPV